MLTMLISIAFLQGPPMPPFPPGMIPYEAVQLVQSFFITVAVIALGIPVIRALSRRFIDRPAAPPAIAGDVGARLERIEQAVDAIAIEVERISEAQRFQTKIMTESRALSAGNAAEAPMAGQRNRDQAR
jgi:hypothetical protein